MVNLSTFKKNKIGKDYKSAFLYGALGIFLIFMIMFPKYVSEGIHNGTNCCLNTLIPSMFPFMILSSMLIISGMKQNINSLLSKITKSLFYLPGYTLPIITISLFGGYPIGAYCTKYLYKNKQINKEQLNRIMSFCVNSGPAFIVSVLGEELLKSPKIGIKLFLIQCVSSILIGICYGVFARFKKIPFYCRANTIKNNNFNFSNILVDSCQSTCHSLVNMCSLITLFFGITSIIDKLNVIKHISIWLQKTGIPPSFTRVFITSTLEMTQGCIVAAGSLYSPYQIYSWIIGFGGICAHTQIIAELKSCPFKYKNFLLVRILNGVLTSLITAITIKNQELHLQTSVNLQQSFKISTSAPTHFGSLVLLIFCTLFTINSCFSTNRNVYK